MAWSRVRDVKVSGESRGVAPEGGRAPIWRAAAQQMSGADCVHLSAHARHMVGMRLSALRLPFIAEGKSLCVVVVGKARAQERVARTILHAVIAGLDPAIHWGAGLLRFAARQHGAPGHRRSEATPFFERLCPVVTRERARGPRHCERQRSNPDGLRGNLDCFAAEFTIGPAASGRTRRLHAMTSPYNAATAATSTSKSSRTRRSMMRSVFGG
jgi:hypothetical protein